MLNGLAVGVGMTLFIFALTGNTYISMLAGAVVGLLIIFIETEN